ncbi:MAG: trypsin-like peptidase domain-containing protein [Alkalinema sp. RU_4_3]|nr:trypsin-like peptidase domain-containing protein [Alkalinema sp. RU_4_3]
MMRIDRLTALTGTAAMVMVVAQPAVAKTAKEVAKVAVPTTVRIDNLLSPKDGGSGVIIGKQGDDYTVLTANHVVKNPNAEYQIYTSKGKSYGVTEVKPLQGSPGQPDLAVVTFKSSEGQAIAPVSNSDEASIGSGIYISGFPMTGDGSAEREFEFTAGQVTSRPASKPEGYTMRYDAVTRRGMSGGPVFDVSGRLVGIHGQGDRESGTVKLESGGVRRVRRLRRGLMRRCRLIRFGR